MVAPNNLAPPDAPSHSPAETAPDPISPMQRWAHTLVLDILKANLPLPRLAEHLNIPFDTLVGYINLPEVQAEIDAYEHLISLRARLLGQTARPISLRKLLDVLESPAPTPTGRDPDADQRTLHRHAELIRRTATTIAREARSLVPRAAPAPKAVLAPKAARTTKRAPEATSGSRSHTGPEPDPSHTAPSPVPDYNASEPVPPVPAEPAPRAKAEPVPAPPSDTEAPKDHSTTSSPPGRMDSRHAFQRADREPGAESSHAPRRARDRPAA